MLDEPGRLLLYSSRRPVQALARAIAAVTPDLVIPCDDRSTEHCAALHAQGSERMRALITRSIGASASYGLFTSRHALLRVAAEAGARVPPTEILRGADDALTLGLEPPLVIKSSGSWGGAGVRIVHDRAATVAAVRSLGRPLGAARALKRLLINRDGFWIAPWRARSIPEVIAQRFVAGDPANIAVACDRGEVLAAIMVRVLRTQGPTGPATVAEVIDNPEILAAARQLVRRLELSGLHGMDFVIDAAGAAWLIEFNPRATQLCHYATAGGVSLAEALVRRLRGQPTRTAPPAPAGARIAFFPQAWRADATNPLLRTAAHDVPWEEPALVADLMLPPWPNRGLLARSWQTVSGAGFANGWAGAAPVVHDAAEPLAAERPTREAAAPRAARAPTTAPSTERVSAG